MVSFYGIVGFWNVFVLFIKVLIFSCSEFYHTERTHIRNLKVICRFFFKPIVEQKLASREFVKLVFGNLDELLGK